MNSNCLTLTIITLLATTAAFSQGTVNFANQSSILGTVRNITFFSLPGVVDGTPVSTNVNGLNFFGLRAQLFSVRPQTKTVWRR